MSKESCEITSDVAVRVRARRAIKSTGLKQKDFALKLDISSAHLSAVLNGHEVLTAKTISLIALHSGVNKNWILSGEGDMFALTPALPTAETQISAGQAAGSIPLPPANPMLDRFPELNQVIQAACSIWKDLDPIERHRLAMQMMADLPDQKK